MFEDKMTPGEQASTWVTRYEYETNCLSILPHFLTLPDPTGVLWSTLPLHLAVALKAPFITVGRLVEREYYMALISMMFYAILETISHACLFVLIRLPNGTSMPG
jgi:hypothetical protein